MTRSKKIVQIFRMNLFLLLFLPIMSTNSLEGAQYLQNAVRDLRKLNYRQTLRRADTAMVSAAATAIPPSDISVPSQIVDRRVQHGDEVPPVTLTKGELTALYETAIAKGETLKLDTGDNSYIHAAVHELDSSESHKSPSYHSPESHKESSDDPTGYYYYYYPIKSFLDEMSSQPSRSSHEYSYTPHMPKEPSTTYRPPYQYHSHHHQHNVTINNKAITEDKRQKTMQPLFMAITGFLSMAFMVLLSAFVLPRFGITPPRTKVFGKKSEKIEDFARLAIDAIEGGACAERFACELSKTARAFHLQDNRFVKLLKRMAPGTFNKHIDRVGKYANKQLKCTAIPCKKKNNNAAKKKNNNSQKKH